MASVAPLTRHIQCRRQFGHGLPQDYHLARRFYGECFHRQTPVQIRARAHAGPAGPEFAPAMLTVSCVWNATDLTMQVSDTPAMQAPVILAMCVRTVS